jgi:hypothetical protein
MISPFFLLLSGMHAWEVAPCQGFPAHLQQRYREVKPRTEKVRGFRPLVLSKGALESRKLSAISVNAGGLGGAKPAFSLGGSG